MGKFYKKAYTRILVAIKLTFVFLGFITFVFCKKPNEYLNGNWYYCEPDSVYNECYFHNDSIFINYNLITGVVTLKYKIFYDSLVIYNSTIINNYKINKSTDNKIYLERNDTAIITLYKIDEKIEYWKLNSDKLYQINDFAQKFLKRTQNKCNCNK